MLFFQLFIIKYHPEDNKCIKTLQVCFFGQIEDLEESTTFTTLVGPAQNSWLHGCLMGSTGHH